MYLKVFTLSISFYFITIKSVTLVYLRKSITISLVLVTLRTRWLDSHQSTKDITSCIIIVNKIAIQNHSRQNSVIRIFVNEAIIMCCSAVGCI